MKTKSKNGHVASDDNFNMRLPASEKRAYKEAAKKRGLDATTWARLLLRKAAGLDKE